MNKIMTKTYEYEYKSALIFIFIIIGEPYARLGLPSASGHRNHWPPLPIKERVLTTSSALWWSRPTSLGSSGSRSSTLWSAPDKGEKGGRGKGQEGLQLYRKTKTLKNSKTKNNTLAHALTLATHRWQWTYSLKLQAACTWWWLRNPPHNSLFTLGSIPTGGEGHRHLAISAKMRMHDLLSKVTFFCI